MKKVFKILLFVLLLLFFPYFFDKIIMNRFITNWDLHDWASFLGAYIGGFITLFGIWWQVTREEKQKEKDEKIGLLKTILYYLKQNIKDRELKEYYFYSLSSYKIMDKIILQNYNKYKLMEINKDFLYSNLKEIFKLENAENIIELADEITKYNVLYIELISEINSRKREMILEELKVLGENFEVNIEILESISSLLNSVTLVFFSKFNKKSLLDIIKQEAEEQEKFEKLVQFLDFFENKMEYHKLIEAKFNIYSGIEKQIEKL